MPLSSWTSPVRFKSLFACMCMLMFVILLIYLQQSMLATTQTKASSISFSQAERIALLEERINELETNQANRDSLPAQPERDSNNPNKNVYAENDAVNDALHPPVTDRHYWERRRVLVTGGAGFVGSHLVDRLMMDGHEVVVVDNLYTGKKHNIQRWLGHPNFEFVHHDVVNPLFIEVDQIYHLASPASPPHYMANPVKTIKTNTIGTINMLGLAKRTHARLLLASTSEVYGDPEVHPQPETYWGHVNPIGPRACYDEGKRVGETLTYAYAAQENVQVRVARIFNTYGPRMHVEDGRVVSNFLWNALHNRPLEVYGNGQQTRSFQYVSDLVDGLVALMNHSSYTMPVNLGNPEEHTIAEFAEIILKRVVPDSTSKIVFRSANIDDPQRRKPDTTVAERELKWKPKVPLQRGLQMTADYFRNLMQEKSPPSFSSAEDKKLKDYG